MIINKLFTGSSMDFSKKCKLRILCSGGLILLGFVALTAASMYGNRLLAINPGTLENQEFIRGFYTGTGCGLIAAAIITIVKNIRLLKNEVLLKKRSLYENDERNRLIGTKCWAYTGYAMFIFLYVGILAAGFVSMTVLKVLLCVLGLYGGLLLIFRLLLQKIM